MIIKIVTEICIENYNMHSRYFRFDLDAGKDFCYRSRLSGNSFAYNPKRFNRNGDKFLYYFQDEVEFVQFNNRSIKTFGEDIYALVPMFELPDIWHFYKEIGYNYKTKKYL